MRASASHAKGGSQCNHAPGGIVDRVDKLVQFLLLVLRERARLLVPARKVYVQVGAHGNGGRSVRRSCARAAGDS
jgi:hypothetical protein